MVRDFKTLMECRTVAEENGKSLELIAVELNFSMPQLEALISRGNAYVINTIKERIAE